MKNKIRYTCSGYKYAPESFKCYMVVINPDGINHSYYFINEFTEEENTAIGTIRISKGKLAAEAEIKRLLRRKQEYHNYITYGYRVLNDNSISYIIRQKINDDANILQKLALYKSIKADYKSTNYIVRDNFIINSFDIDRNFNATNLQKQELQYEVDPTPIKIKFK